MPKRDVLSRQHWAELLATILPLLLIIGLQYVSMVRLSQVRVLAHQSQVRGYLDSLSSDLRETYRALADRTLAVPGEALVARRFDVINAHFVKTVHPAVKQLFVGVLEDCSCKTQFFDPERGSLSLETDPSTQAAVLRVSARWRLQQGRFLSDSDLLVDQQDPNNRIIYRVVSDADHRIEGVVGLVIDGEYFVNSSVPTVVEKHLEELPSEVRTNIIVSLQAAGGQSLYVSHVEAGRDDAMAVPLAFVFDDWRLSARSRHTTAQQLASSTLIANVSVSLLMAAVVLVGIVMAIRAERRSEKLARLKTEFVSSVTHDLRTPLSSIALMGEFLRLGRVVSAAKIQEYGSRIEAESYRLRQFIDNILGIARIESDQHEYLFEDVPIDEVVAKAIRAVELPLRLNGFVLHYHASEEPVPLVHVDSAAVAQAIINLIDNASKYSGRSRDIRVRVDATAEGVAVHVIDSGIGIAAADHDKIFDKFYRVSNASGERVSGTGLGLAIVKHVVEAHHGSIVVRSEPGKGCTFTILLPVTRYAGEAEDAGRVPCKVVEAAELGSNL